MWLSSTFFSHTVAEAAETHEHRTGPDLVRSRMAVLLDLVHGCCPACTAASLQREADSRLFLLCGDSLREDGGFSETLPSPRSSVQVLDSGSTAECLFRFKQILDQLDLSSVRVWTSPRGREELLRYQELLFTAVYHFEYKVEQLTCPSCTGPAHTDSPGLRVQEDVSRFLQQLPALRGPVRVLKSTLVPGGFNDPSGAKSVINPQTHLCR